MLLYIILSYTCELQVVLLLYGMKEHVFTLIIIFILSLPYLKLTIYTCFP